MHTNIFHTTLLALCYSSIFQPSKDHFQEVWLIPCIFCAMLPLETLPPGEPSGGVVYLRIVLSPEEASCLQVFLNMNVSQGGVVSTSPNPSWRTTPCRLSTTAYSIYSQLPSTKEAVPLSATWGRAMPWWQGPTTHGLYGEQRLKCLCKRSC